MFPVLLVDGVPQEAGGAAGVRLTLEVLSELAGAFTMQLILRIVPGPANVVATDIR
jgi:hypothetical protein